MNETPSELHSMLSGAAEAEPVRFDHHDVARRVRRKKQNRLMSVAGAFVVLAAAVLFQSGRTDGDDTTIEFTGTLGELTVDELTAEPWYPFVFRSVATTDANDPYLRFREDGSFTGVGGCDVVSGQWSVRDGRLVINDLSDATPEVEGCRGDDGGDFLDLLAGSPEIGRVDGQPGTMELRNDDLAIGFRPFTSLGEPASEDAIAGTWSQADGGAAYAFEADGVLEVSIDFAGEIGSCTQLGSWSFEGDLLIVDGDFQGASNFNCERADEGAGVVGLVGPTPFADSSRVRIGDDRMWLASDDGRIFSLVRHIGTTPSDPTPDDTTAFCADAPDASVEVPESYVGSDEHVENLRDLLTEAPAELRNDLDLIITHFDDAVDPAEPDSQVVENFPADVNKAIEQVAAYIDENCAG